jgi:hypothetical protein
MEVVSTEDPLGSDAQPRLWSPLVYGRTRYVDEWWRAKPAEGISPEQASVVRAVVAGGRGLAPQDQPRFALSRDSQQVLVAVACSAASVSGTMNTESRERSLYTLVGWLTDDLRAQVPSLAEFAVHALDWASAEYERWVALTWEDRVAPWQPTPPSEPPWAPPETPVTGERLVFKPGTSLIVPESQAGALWDAARMTTRQVAVVVGWKHRSHADLQSLNAIAAADVESPTRVRASSSAPRSAPHILTKISAALEQILRPR